MAAAARQAVYPYCLQWRICRLHRAGEVGCGVVGVHHLREMLSEEMKDERQKDRI